MTFLLVFLKSNGSLSSGDSNHKTLLKTLKGRETGLRGKMIRMFSFLPSDPLIQLFVEYMAMAPHSSTLAWRIPGTEEPGKLQSMRSQRDMAV